MIRLAIFLFVGLALAMAKPVKSQGILPGIEEVDALQAIANGRGVSLLESYEKKILSFEQLARSSNSSRETLLAAAENYRLASLVSRMSGDFQKSIRYAEKMLALSESLDDLNLRHLALSSLFTAYQSTRNLTKTDEILQLRFRLAGELDPESPDWLWWTSELYKHLGDQRQARAESAESVVAYDRSILLKEEYLRYSRTIGNLQPKLYELWRQRQANAYAGLGRAYISLNKLDLALASFQRGLEILTGSVVTDGMSALYRGLGEVLRKRGDFTEAIANLRKALDLARLQQRPAWIASAAGQIADILVVTGKSNEAITYYEDAIAQAESMRSLLTSQSNRQSFFSLLLPNYWGLIDILWHTKSYNRAFDYSERVRSRGFLDLLGTKVQLARPRRGVGVQGYQLSPAMASGDFAANRSLDNILAMKSGNDAEKAYQALLEALRKEDPEQASLLSVQPLTLTQVQGLLEPGQVLVEYLVTPANVYGWTIDKEQLKTFLVRVPRAELVQKVQKLRSAISERDSLKTYHTIARDLYDQLLAPAEPQINKKELIIVPHDLLHNVPFHALVASDDRYLIEKLPIQYLSSASLMQFTWAKRRALGKTILVFGNPAIGESARDLKFAEQEAAEVKKVFPTTTQLLRAGATKLKVTEIGSQYDILHFAAHTELRQDDPLSSAVLLAKGRSDDGKLTVRDIFGLDLKASLVVLSGCETALGKLSSGDELVGLTRAFIYAGTPSVVASLWKVDDASTAQLMSSFYRNLKSKTKVESLRQAQLDMIRGKVNLPLFAQRGVGGIAKFGETPGAQRSAPGSVSVSHPYFWAPFILVGDGK